MIRLVQSADAGKAKIVGLADRWATWIVVIALTAAAFTWLLSGEIIRAVTILVVFCPCALVLATPTAIMAAIGNATKHGFLVKEGDSLERLAAVSKVVFDKTGTLTYGTPEVVSVESLSPGYSQKDIYRFCAAAELHSEHPLGKAVVRCYKKEIDDEIYRAEEFKMIPGRGVSCKVNKKEILAGNREMLLERGIDVSREYMIQAEKSVREGCTVIYISVEGIFAGYVVLSDTLREESGEMIRKLSQLKVQPVLLTGDHQSAADTIAAKLKIQEIHANCLPEDKLKWIEKYQEGSCEVCMIGDGVNDAPALKKANIGIAMGGVGSDISLST